MAEPNHTSPHWSEAVAAAFAGSLAVWTICCQTVVFLGGTFFQLLVLASLVFGALGLWLWKQWRTGSLRSLWPRVGATPPDDTDRDTSATRVFTVPVVDVSISAAPLLSVSVLAATVVAVPSLYSRPLWLWWWVSGCLTLGAWISYRDHALPPTLKTEPRRHGVWLVVICLLCAAYALAAHRPDADDAFYVNVAAAAIERPDLPLFGSDTLHGLDSLSVPYSVYRLHSWELLNAAVAFAGGFSALSSFHFLAAALVAFVAPLAWTSLLRRLIPQAWFPTLVTLLFVLIWVGDAHRWYGNFFLVRIWQGKAVFLMVVLPLIWAWSLAFGRRPSWCVACWLVVSQIAAVGATSTAVWAAPVALAGGLLAGASRKSLPWIVLALLCVSTYPLAMGLAVKRGMQHVSERIASSLAAVSTGATPVSPSQMSAAATPAEISPLLQAMSEVCGGRLLVPACLVALTAAWTLVPTGTCRKFAVMAVLLPWLTLLNPYLHRLIASQVTGPSYWRAFWILPIPLCLALVLAAPWHLVRKRTSAALAALALLIGFSLLPTTFGWSSRNQDLAFHGPRYKVPLEALGAASRLGNLVADGAIVVADNELSTWSQVLQEQMHPVAVRGYLRLKGYPRRDRLNMRAIADGKRWTIARLDSFRTALTRHHVEAVQFRSVRATKRMEQTLEQAGFERAVDAGKFQIWVRRGLDPRGDPNPGTPLVWR